MYNLVDKTIHKIKLNVDKKTIDTPTILVKQYDQKSRYIEATIYENNEKKDCSNYKIRLNATLSNGTPMTVENGEFDSNNKCYIEIPGTFLFETGLISCDISFLQLGSVVLTTETFYINVDKSNYNEIAECGENPESYRNMIDKQIQEMNNNITEIKYNINNINDITDDISCNVETALNDISNINTNLESINTDVNNIKTELDKKVNNSLRINDKDLKTNITLTADDVGAVSESEYTEFKSEIGNTLDKEVNNLKNIIEDINNRMDLIKGNITDINGNIANIENNRESIYNKISEITSHNEYNENLYPNVKAVVDYLNTKSDEIFNKISDKVSSNIVNEIQDSISDLNNVIENINNNINNLKNNKENLSDKVAEIELDYKESETLYPSVKAVVYYTNEVSNEIKGRVNTVNSDVDKVKTDLVIIKNSIENLDSYIKDIYSKISAMNESIGNAFMLVSELETNIKNNISEIENKISDVENYINTIDIKSIQFDLSDIKNEIINIYSLINFTDTKITKDIETIGEKIAYIETDIIDIKSIIKNIESIDSNIDIIKEFNSNIDDVKNDILEDVSGDIKAIKTPNMKDDLITPDNKINSIYLPDNINVDANITPESIGAETVNNKVDFINEYSSNINYPSAFGVYSFVKSQKLTFENIYAGDWQYTSYYEKYPYSCDIYLDNVTSSDFANVIFGYNELISGNYLSICHTEQNIVRIYSQTNEPISIPLIMIDKNVSNSTYVPATYQWNTYTNTDKYRIELYLEDTESGSTEYIYAMNEDYQYGSKYYELYENQDNQQYKYEVYDITNGNNLVSTDTFIVTSDMIGQYSTFTYPEYCQFTIYWNNPDGMASSLSVNYKNEDGTSGSQLVIMGGGIDFAQFNLPKGEYYFDLWVDGFEGINHQTFSVIEEDVQNGYGSYSIILSPVQSYLYYDVNLNFKQYNFKLYVHNTLTGDKQLYENYYKDEISGSMYYSLPLSEDNFEYVAEISNISDNEIVYTDNFRVTEVNTNKIIFYPTETANFKLYYPDSEQTEENHMSLKVYYKNPNGDYGSQIMPRAGGSDEESGLDFAHFMPLQKGKYYFDIYVPGYESIKGGEFEVTEQDVENGEGSYTIVMKEVI